MKWISMFLVIALTASITTLTGCNEAIFDPAAVQQLAKSMDQINQEVDKTQDVMSDLSAKLDEHGLLTEGLAETIAKVQSEADKVQDHASTVTSEVAAVDIIDKSDLEAIIAQIQAANTASAPWNPYAAPIAGGLGIFSVLASWFGWTKKKELDKLKEPDKQPVAVSGYSFEDYERERDRVLKAVSLILTKKKAAAAGDPDMQAMILKLEAEIAEHFS